MAGDARETCRGTTVAGARCRLPAGPGGYCRRHDPATGADSAGTAIAAGAGAAMAAGGSGATRRAASEPGIVRQAGSSPSGARPGSGDDETFHVFTDGACVPNPGPGGWGAVIRQGHTVRELNGGEAGRTTNNRMELMAAIEALESLPDGSRVVLSTDSSYVKNGITTWIAGWRRKGWRSSTGDPVKNQDLWQRLDAATARHAVRWEWVKGHAGHPENERADRLAAAGIPRGGGSAPAGPTSTASSGSAPRVAAPASGRSSSATREVATSASVAPGGAAGSGSAARAATGGAGSASWDGNGTTAAARRDGAAGPRDGRDREAPSAAVGASTKGRRTIAARYPGVCRGCGSRYAAGTPIARGGVAADPWWGHPDCVDAGA